MPPTEPPPTTADSAWPYIGVGCLTLVVGFFGGGMIAVLVGKVVDGITGCRPADGLPACTWWWYVLIGGALGGIGLPTIAIHRLRRGRRRAAASSEHK